MTQCTTFRLLLFTLFSLFFLNGRASEALNQPDTSAVHELTIYAIPSQSELDWKSPSSILQTALESYTQSIFKRYSIPIGHIFIEFSTPLIDSVVLTSITTAPGTDMGRMVLIDKVGLGILGATFKGRMESSKELQKKINLFGRKKQLAFIKYRISEEAALRVKKYLEVFTKKKDGGFSPSGHYGGAFWPRYEYEGAGCSAFGISAMEIAGLYIDHPEWRVSFNIPMDLVGGSFNNHKRVKARSIKKRYHWHDGSGVENVDYIPFTIYDPSLIFNWILKQRELKGELVPMEKNKIPGLYFDARKVSISQFEPIFIKRKKPSIFIDIFRKDAHL